jgi:hypothetical protein
MEGVKDSDANRPTTSGPMTDDESIEFLNFLIFVTLVRPTYHPYHHRIGPCTGDL